MDTTNVNIYRTKNCCEFLNQVLKEKKTKNPKFSLRSFANHLNFADPGTLSRILQKKRKLSMDQVYTIVQKLNLNKDEIRFFELLAQLDLCRAKQNKIYLQNSLNHYLVINKFLKITPKEFLIVSEWYCTAILELFNLKDFLGTEKEIIQKLRKIVSKEKITEGISSLLKVGLITYKNNLFLKNEKASISFNSTIENKAIRRFHKQMISQAVKKIDYDVNKRHLSGTTICISKDNYNKAIQIISDAHKKILSIEKVKGDYIYHFSTQFFPLID